MSDPSSSAVPALFRPPRLIRLVLLGVILTPVAAIIGAIAAPGTLAIWIFAALTFLVTQQWNASGAM